MRKKLLILMATLYILFLIGCTKPDKSTEVLTSQGFTDIEIEGYRFFGCSSSDLFHTGFKARSFNGQVVEGVVCSGILKGNTVRLD